MQIKSLRQQHRFSLFLRRRTIRLRLSFTGSGLMFGQIAQHLPRPTVRLGVEVAWSATLVRVQPLIDRFGLLGQIRVHL